MGTRWEGVLAPINAPTGDGRRMAPGAFTHRPLPLPLRWQRPETSGHDDAVTVGVIDTLRIDDEAGHVWGEGELFDDISPATNPRLAEDVNEAKYLLGKKAIGPSVDPGHASAVAVIAGTDQPYTEQSMFEQMLAGATEAPATETLFTAYEIAGATLVPVPAFAECRPFELIGPGVAIDTPTGLSIQASEVRTSGWGGLPIAMRDHAWDGDAAAGRLAEACGINGDSPDWGCYASGFLYRDTEADPHTRGAYSWPLVDVIDGERTLVPAAVYAAANILAGGRGGSNIPAAKQASMRTVVGKLYKKLAKHFDDQSIKAPWGDDEAKAAILAAAMLGIDPAVFTDPQLSEITPITRQPMSNGMVRVFGHVAAHETCLVGRRDMCITAPFSTCDYTQFHRYHSTDDGSMDFPLPVGRLTAAFGSLENTCRCCPGNDDHACANISFGAAIAHHDRMETLAYVRAGEDEANGAIWFSGIEAPQISERGQQLLSRRKISGDWRFVRGDMELTEILVLNRREPGFPLPRASMRGGRQLALTAAGVVRAPMDRQEQTVTGTHVDEFASAHPAGWGDAAVPLGAAFEIDYDRLGVSVAEALILAAQTGDDTELAFNPGQKRGPGGRWIKGGGVGGGSKEAPDVGGGHGDAGKPSRPAGHQRELDDASTNAKWLRSNKQRSDAKYMETWIERYEQAEADGDTEEADVAADILRKSNEVYNRYRTADAPGNTSGPTRAQRDTYNKQIRDLGMRINGQSEYDDEENTDFDEELDNILTDLDDAVEKGDKEQADELADEVAQILRGQWGLRDDMPKLPGVTAAAAHTGAMLALRMTEEDAARLAVSGGLPVDELHMTLAYLGEADAIDETARQKMVDRVTKYATGLQPVKADGFAVNAFNPGNANDRETALVLGVGGEGLQDVYSGAIKALSGAGHEMPQQHEPWAPHVTLQYTEDLNRVKAMADRVGPVTFDRMRLAFGGDVIDVPLGGFPTVGQGYDLVNADMALRARAAQAKLAIASGKGKVQ